MSNIKMTIADLFLSANEVDSSDIPVYSPTPLTEKQNKQIKGLKDNVSKVLSLVGFTLELRVSTIKSIR